MKNQNIKLGAVALTLLGALPGAFAANPTTVSVFDTNPGGQTIQNSPNNLANLNFVTQSTMSSLMTTAFANNTGGVITFDTAQGWSQNVNQNAFTVSYGTSQSSLLTLTRTDGAGNNTFGSTSGSGTTQVSGDAFVGFQNSSSPLTFSFSQGLVDWGITQLSRSGDRTVTLSFTLQDSSVVSLAADTVLNNSTTLNWYGFQATSANPIESVTISSPNGYVRFDDMAFVVATVPEPGSISLAIAGGLSLSFIIARRRKV